MGVLAEHISNTKGQCLERVAEGMVKLSVCRSSSEAQKWVFTDVNEEQRKVGYGVGVEEVQEGMLQAGSFSSKCLSIDGKLQLVIEECSVLKASHVWRWYTYLESDALSHK